MDRIFNRRLSETFEADELCSTITFMCIKESLKQDCLIHITEQEERFSQPDTVGPRGLGAVQGRHHTAV